MPTLTWIGKDAVVNHHRQVPFHLLKDVPELACGEPGEGNLIVQGDNLVALKALLPYYAGQVKCIYIDPPYNTGNEGWVYNDNVKSPLIQEWLNKVVGKEGETLDRHDRWLCMMYPRLKLLHRFLKDDGAIFISIDDNEVHNLRALLDAIFGAANFIATFIWEKRTTRENRRVFSFKHDFVVCYAREKSRFEAVRGKLPYTDTVRGRFKNPDGDPRGPWQSVSLAAQEGHATESQFYTIVTPSGRGLIPPAGNCWRVTVDRLCDLLADDRVWFGKQGKNVPRRKIFLSESGEELVPETIWSAAECGTTDTATKTLNELFGGDSHFNTTPKPPELIERVLQIAVNPGELILDSFSGSGTTGHAVLKKNSAAKDKEPRRFILVEIEPKIAREITSERVRRVAEGYTNAKGELVAGIGGGFRYCELGERMFEDDRKIRDAVRFADLARHVYFTETGEPLPRERISAKSPFLAACRGVGIYLLFNGILGDKSAQGGNVLTRATLAQLSPFDGPKVIYCAGCLLGRDRLQAERITARQTPYEIKAI